MSQSRWKLRMHLAWQEISWRHLLKCLKTGAFSEYPYVFIYWTIYIWRCWEPKVLEKMSSHYETKKSLSPELIEKIIKRLSFQSWPIVCWVLTWFTADMWMSVFSIFVNSSSPSSTWRCIQTKVNAIQCPSSTNLMFEINLRVRWLHQSVELFEGKDFLSKGWQALPRTGYLWPYYRRLRCWLLRVNSFKDLVVIITDWLML